MQESLSQLKQTDLLIELKTLVRQEKSLTLKIVDYLAEISRRRAYLPAHTSLFGFLVNELGYCPSTAQLRLNTLKALQTVPEVRDKVLNNEVSLNHLAKTQSFINHENKTARNQEAPPLTRFEQRELFAAAETAPAHKLDEVLQTKKHEIDVRKAESLGLPPPRSKPFTKKVSLEIDPELSTLMEELKSLLSHSIPDGDWPALLKKALPLAIRETKIAKGLMKRSDFTKPTTTSGPATDTNRLATQYAEPSEQKQKTTQISPDTQTDELTSSMNKQCVKFPNKPARTPNKIHRAIPTAIRRKVWLRDGGRCQFVDQATKKRCESQHQIEFEHLRPWTFGGDHSEENVVTMCSYHNRHRWQKCAAENRSP